tara:strand:+ start:43 stop:618 length:576 start_codon:yes stop_codon:yes gene_type:complete
MNLIEQVHEKKILILLEIYEEVQLRILQEKDVTDKYVNWMNDYEVVKFTEQHSFTHTKEMVNEFVTKKFNSKCDFLFGIYFNNNHIGNIKLGPINTNNLISDISYFIGDKKLWGKGIASKALMSVIHFAFDTLKLEKINAGYYQEAVASEKLLNKCGFKFESIIKPDLTSSNPKKTSIRVVINRNDFLLLK